MAIDSIKVNLYSLPCETLQQIADYLSSSHRPSLYTFSLASKTCYSATLPLIFHQINLLISSRESLQRNVDALAKTLSQTESARHVRCLNIKGSFQLSNKPKVEGYKSETWDWPKWYKSTGLDEILGEEPYLHYTPHVVYDEPVIVKSSEEDLTWTPVVNLIKNLPCLNKLVYNCRNQFPPSLLDALHDYQPQCKLYHLTFKFRTLLWGTPYPYEMALATSPCLYSVKVECCWRDSEGDDDFNGEAVLELVAGLAPNLKEVVVMYREPENSRRFWRRQRAPWRGLPGFVPGQSIGSLTSLSLLGVADLTSPNLLQTWAKHTDFRHLRHLTLGGGLECKTRGINDEVMEWITQNCSLPRLKTLHIRMTRDEAYVLRPNYADRAIALFGALEPLDELLVSGPLEPKILDAILCHHGQTLVKLDLRPYEYDYDRSSYRGRMYVPMTLTNEHVLQIRAQCPVLRDLAIPIKRTRSDKVEVEIYKSLGKIKRLRSLFLTFDCSDWRMMEDLDSSDAISSFDAADLETYQTIGRAVVYKGHVREGLMNCAVDETLARSIWGTIRQSSASQELESLRLWTKAAGGWGNLRHGSTSEVFNNLSRSWLIERGARDDEDAILVRELGRRAREANDEMERDRSIGLAKTLEVRRFCEDGEDVTIDPRDAEETRTDVRIFRRIWPRKEDSKDWRDDWSSFPLQV